MNLSNIQYIYRYRVSPIMNIGAGPNILINWNADGEDVWTVPVGLGIDRVFKVGKMPIKIGVEAYYYVATPDKYGPEWAVRFVFTPVLRAPAWSKEPLFGADSL